MPGGRVEIGENFEEALHREVQEETGLKVSIDYPLYVGEWRPVIKGTQNQIVGVFMVCTPLSDKITLSTEHDDYQWINPSERKKYDVMDPEDKVIDRYAEGVARK
jgi:8-oxo-dGTP pyrophosphatase MutT (NUDIX family)